MVCIGIGKAQAGTWLNRKSPSVCPDRPRVLHSSAWKMTLTTDVHSARELHAPWMVDHSSKEVQVGLDKLEVVASFCYLGDMLSAADGCELANTIRVKTVWKKFKDLLPVLSSRHLSLKKYVAVSTALVCGAQCSMPARLGHWQSQTSSVCSEMTGQWSDRSAMSGRKTLSPPGPMSFLCGLALRIWTSRREDWWYGRVTLQWCSQGSLWHTGWWKACDWEAQDDMETADREGLQRVEVLGHQPSWWTYLEMWCKICHACSKPAVWKGAHWCGFCPCTGMLIKNLIMIHENVLDCLSNIIDFFLLFCNAC